MCIKEKRALKIKTLISIIQYNININTRLSGVLENPCQVFTPTKLITQPRTSVKVNVSHVNPEGMRACTQNGVGCSGEW